MLELIEKNFAEHQEVLQQSMESILYHVNTASILTVETIKNGGKILLIGNGGSASDAQHIAAEFTGRYVKEREPLPAIALTTDTSALTAIGNDYGFEQVFSRQMKALAHAQDLVIAISTSGNSANVLEAVKVAKEVGCKVVGLSGKDGGALGALCDVNIVVPSNTTARIQEMHILIGHILCDSVDSMMDS